MENNRRLIAENDIYALFEKNGTAKLHVADIDVLPRVDAVEVVYGQWEDFCRGKMCCCSVCKAEFDNTCNEIHDEWHYCPNCGAKMDGGVDNG